MMKVVGSLGPEKLEGERVWHSPMNGNRLATVT
jgi:hypothetical protein